MVLVNAWGEEAHKALADANNKAHADQSPILGTGGLGLTDKQLEEVVSAYYLDGGWVRSASQLSGCSELGLTDAQLVKLARSCDLIATDGDGSAGASARASGYSEDQQERIKRVDNKALADAHKALADTNKALADQSALLGNGGLGLTADQLEKVVRAYCLEVGWVRSAFQGSGCSVFGLLERWSAYAG